MKQYKLLHIPTGQYLTAYGFGPESDNPTEYLNNPYWDIDSQDYVFTSYSKSHVNKLLFQLLEEDRRYPHMISMYTDEACSEIYLTKKEFEIVETSDETI